MKARTGISNTYLGWTLLVDEQARVRWIAHGHALESEVTSMLRLARVLKDRSFATSQK